MLSWQKIDVIPGWFMFQSYCIWRALLDFQSTTAGDLFEIGVWRGRSATVLANYRKGPEKLYLCDLRLDEAGVRNSMRAAGVEAVNLVPLSGPSSELPAKLDLRAMHQSVRWLHIDGEHTGTAVYRDLEFANSVVMDDGIVVIDDFFAPRDPANTIAVIRYMEKNPFHFRLLAVGFNKGYLCRPGSLPRYMEFMATGMPRALVRYGCKATIFKTAGPWDSDTIGITEFVFDAGAIAGPDNEPQYWHVMSTRPVWSIWRHIQNGWRMLKERL